MINHQLDFEIRKFVIRDFNLKLPDLLVIVYYFVAC